jgi:hypothetical protein
MDFKSILLKNVVIRIKQGKSVSLECEGFVIRSLLPNVNLRLLWIKDSTRILINRSLSLNSIQEYDSHAIDLLFIEKVNQNHAGIYECQIHNMENIKKIWITNKIELKVLGFSHIFKSKTFIFYQNTIMRITLVGTCISFVFNFYFSWNNFELGVKKYIEMKKT